MNGRCWATSCTNRGSINLSTPGASSAGGSHGRDVRARALVSCPNNLAEATLAYSLFDGIVLAEGVLHLELVVVVLVVPLGLGGFRRALLDLPFCFFLVVDLCG